MKNLLTVFFLILTAQLIAQISHSHLHNRAIEFPDIPGYKTMKCDFHIHSVLSDGSVWPNIRVEEAVRDSLDVISLTEHLEYQPHSEDIPHPDRNRAYVLAEELARPFNLLIVNGSEITRDMPPGHTNAIFIQDANKLLIKDSIEVFREAKRQGAFTFWNHPNWVSQRPDGIATLTDVHRRLIREGLLDGIEVVNDITYSDEALQIALDNNLVIMGTSDIHGLVDWQYKVSEGGHRPITLVFAEERSTAAIKAGLENRRTVVWYNNTLIGRSAYLTPLLEACLQIEKVTYQGAAAVAEVTIRNNSDSEFILANLSPYNLHTTADIVIIHPNTTTMIQVKTLEQLPDFELKFKVLNAVLAPKVHPDITLKVKVE